MSTLHENWIKSVDIVIAQTWQVYWLGASTIQPEFIGESRYGVIHVLLDADTMYVIIGSLE